MYDSSCNFLLFSFHDDQGGDLFILFHTLKKVKTNTLSDSLQLSISTFQTLNIVHY